MRKISTSLFIFFVLLFSGVFFVQAEERPLPVFSEIKNTNKNIEAELIKNFGQNSFNECFGKSCQNCDMANSFSYNKWLYSTWSCLDENKKTESENCEKGFVYSSGRCISDTQKCREEYGEHSYFGDDGYCHCAEESGYGWNDDRTKCVVRDICEEGKIFYNQYRKESGEYLHPRCFEKDEACQGEFGEGAVYAPMEGKEVYCDCGDGYEWDEKGETCVQGLVVLGIESPFFVDTAYSETIERERALSNSIDYGLSRALSGRILLQVKESGEAWYVSTVNKRRYFLGSPSSAFEVMRELGLGATHEFISSYEFYPESVWGKILIDVDDFGKAYYINPLDRKAHYLGVPRDAFKLMQELGLGISNEDIRKISVAEVGQKYCDFEERNIDTCKIADEQVCGWFNESAIMCVAFPCAANYSNNCEACKDEIVDYWIPGVCPK